MSRLAGRYAPRKNERRVIGPFDRTKCLRSGRVDGAFQEF